MQINVESQIRNYSISIEPNFDFIEKIAAISPKKVILDVKVWNEYKGLFQKKISEKEIFLIEALEEKKNINYVLQICDELMNYSAKKNITLISFGGGITQDVTGFLSSILYRGIRWIFIPTTLLAQADSCMGSKTSLNYKHYKNLLGSFYPPTEIYVNVDFTKTLSEMDFYSGIGEVVKLHLMGGIEKINRIKEIIDTLSINRMNSVFLKEIVQNSLAIKYSYIKDDEFDTGRRNLLNYGHCFGHAFEVSSSYEVPHGIAVVVGMVFANIIAVQRGMLSREHSDRIYKFILSKCIKCSLFSHYFDKKAIADALKKDKKRIGKGLPLIILKDNWELEKLIDMTEIELSMGIDLMLNLFDLQ